MINRVTRAAQNIPCLTSSAINVPSRLYYQTPGTYTLSISQRVRVNEVNKPLSILNYRMSFLGVWSRGQWVKQLTQPLLFKDIGILGAWLKQRSLSGGFCLKGALLDSFILTELGHMEPVEARNSHV